MERQKWGINFILIEIEMMFFVIGIMYIEFWQLNNQINRKYVWKMKCREIGVSIVIELLDNIDREYR